MFSFPFMCSFFQPVILVISQNPEWHEEGYFHVSLSSSSESLPFSSPRVALVLAIICCHFLSFSLVRVSLLAAKRGFEPSRLKDVRDSILIPLLLS